MASKICFLKRNPNTSLDIPEDKKGLSLMEMIFEISLYTTLHKHIGINSLKLLRWEDLGIKSIKVAFRAP